VLAALGGGYALAANAPTPRQVVSPPQAPAEFVGITPVRVLDTRGAAGGPIGVPAAAKLGAGQSIDVAVAGVDTIPADATSVAVNITIDEDATLKSFLPVWPTGETRPNASANNAEPGLVMANSAIFQLGTDGKLSVFNQLGTVNVIMDVTGYFVASGTAPTTTTTEATTTTTVAPGTLTADQAAYDPGDTVTYTGADFPAECTDMTVSYQLGTDTPVVADSGITPTAGGFTGDFLAPTDTGTYTLAADSATPNPACHAETTFDVPIP
jgi:hypothetical protein